jgi:hypothetical protein
MPTYFEMMDELNKSRTKNGISGVTMDSPNDPNTTGYGPLAPLFSASTDGTPRQFMNQCRTNDNPAGWVPGSGGWDHPNPLDMGPGPGGNWPAWYWTANQMDNAIQHGAYLRSTGMACPGTPQAVAAAAAASPFITPNQPANSPYGVVTNPQPLLKSFYDQPSLESVAAANKTSGGGMAIQFNASRTGNTFYVGDSWIITISGAPANAVVKEHTTPFGNTDVNGNWSKSGTFTNDVVGNWQEVWSVGGVVVGNWNFNVLPGPPPNQQNTTGQMANQTGQMASGASALGTDTTGISDILTGSILGGVPNWILLAGVLGVGLIVMSGDSGGGYRRR